MSACISSSRGTSRSRSKAEGAAGDGRQGERLARLPVETIEASLQRLDRGRDGQLVDVDGELPAAVAAAEGAALDQVADRLLEEEWVPARALGQELGHGLRQLALRGVRDQDARGIGRQRAHLDLSGGAGSADACSPSRHEPCSRSGR